MTLRWIGEFESGNVTWALIGAASVLLLVLPGLLLLLAGLRGNSAPEEGFEHRLTFIAAMTLGWGLWIYTLGFAPSIGSRPKGETAAVPNDLLDLMRSSSIPVNPDNPFGRGGWLGSEDYALLRQLHPEGSTTEPLFPTRRPQHQLPHSAFLAFQLMLFLAAVSCVEAMAGFVRREGRSILFGLLWGTLVYAPAAHWLWGDGWLLLRGAIDSGAGLFHLVIGCSALACAFGGRATERVTEGESPAVAGIDRRWVGIGAILLCGGALLLQATFALKPAGPAGAAFLNSQLGLAGGLIAWRLTSALLGRRDDIGGVAAGALAGLAANAAGCAVMAPQSALVAGIVGGVTGNVVFACRPARASVACWTLFCASGVAGILGLMLSGVFAASSMGAVTWNDRLISGLIDGTTELITHQAIAAASLSGWVLLGTGVLVFLFRRLPQRPEVS